MTFAALVDSGKALVELSPEEQDFYQKVDRAKRAALWALGQVHLAEAQIRTRASWNMARENLFHRLRPLEAAYNAAVQAVWMLDPTVVFPKRDAQPAWAAKYAA